MRHALDDAGLVPDDIGYINAHATSTPIGDAIEVFAIDKVFNGRNENISGPLLVSSTKGATGHLLGAAGAVETAFTALALRDGVIPPTLNLENADSISTVFHHVPHKSIRYDEHIISHNSKLKDGNGPKKLVYALKNSFGFGGMNASLVLAKFAS
jgi:3-oxoacyl-[acyl-carrier-protein] synthase II